MTHRGPFQPLLFCDSVNSNSRAITQCPSPNLHAGQSSGLKEANHGKISRVLLIEIMDPLLSLCRCVSACLATCRGVRTGCQSLCCRTGSVLGGNPRQHLCPAGAAGRQRADSWCESLHGATRCRCHCCCCCCCCCCPGSRAVPVGTGHARRVGSSVASAVRATGGCRAVGAECQVKPAL